MSEDIYDLCLTKAKQSIRPYVYNNNINSLRYDAVWGGIVGHNGLNCSNPDIYCPCMDFCASYYNDHHYHYGYLLYTSAVLAYLDSDWIEGSKIWVENLIRDVANPSTQDKYFPVFRSFDWFAGHSWANGIFPMADGKDIESTSEEINFHYALMLWGIATKSDRLEKLGNLMFAITKRTVQKYFLMKSGNKIHPPSFVNNKAPGISFENKVHYTTWFGANTEFIHGIQMLPYLPVTELVREYEFVKEEWDTRLSGLNLQDDNAWKSILYLNYGTINKEEAFKVLQVVKLDDGLSRSWGLYSISTRKDPPLAQWLVIAIWILCGLGVIGIIIAIIFFIICIKKRKKKERKSDEKIRIKTLIKKR